MVKEDSISLIFTVCGLILPVFLLPFVMDDFHLFATLIFAWVLCGTGLVLQLYAGKKIERDPTLSEKEVKDIGTYTLIAVLFMVLASFVHPRLFTSMIPSDISTNDQLMFGAFYAISEERFFRGGLLNLFYSLIHSKAAASLASAAIFVVCHFKIYGTSVDALQYVGVIGFVFGQLALDSGRWAVPLLGHFINNAWSVMA